MNKTLLTILLLLGFSFAANAQWYFGGSLGFGTTSQNKFSIRVAPEAGYRFTNTFTLGGKLSYVSGYNQFGVDPYARVSFIKPESVVRIMATLHAPLYFASSYFSYGVYLQPGLSIRLAPTVRLECHVGAFGWGSVTSGGNTYSSWQATIDSNNVSVGVVFSI